MPIRAVKGQKAKYMARKLCARFQLPLPAAQKYSCCQTPFFTYISHFYCTLIDNGRLQWICNTTSYKNVACHLCLMKGLWKSDGKKYYYCSFTLYSIMHVAFLRFYDVNVVSFVYILYCTTHYYTTSLTERVVFVLLAKVLYLVFSSFFLCSVLADKTDALLCMRPNCPVFFMAYCYITTCSCISCYLTVTNYKSNPATPWKPELAGYLKKRREVWRQWNQFHLNFYWNVFLSFQAPTTYYTYHRRHTTVLEGWHQKRNKKKKAFYAIFSA